MEKNILISSDLFNFMKINKREKITQLIDYILTYIDKLIKEKNTIIIPTYNFNFFKTRETNYKINSITTGYLNKRIVENFNFCRTHRPIYNYAIIGPNTEKLCDLKQTTAWGNDSVIGYLSMNKNSKALGIGVDPNNFGWVTIHVCEEYAKVPYRYFKNFKGFNKDLKKEVSEKMFVKKLSFKKTINHTLISKYLKNNKKIKQEKVCGVDFSTIYLSDCFNHGVNILNKNPYVLLE